MKVKIASSQKKAVSAIVADLKAQIGNMEVKLLQFYASPAIDPHELSAQIQQAFAGVATFGCTTSGEIISGQMLDHSVVAMAFNSEIVGNCKIEVLEDISSDSTVVDRAFDSFAHYFGTDMTNLDPHKYVGIVLIDGLSGREEVVNERIGDLTSVTFIGASSGDDLQFTQTHIFANGRAYSNAAVLVLIKCNTEFDILKTQSFRSAGKNILVTKADESTRTIIEINGKSAVTEYARLVGVAKENAASAFAKHPVGLAFNDDFFVRSPQRIDGENIVFYCSIKEGMELELLVSDNIVDGTKAALQEKIKTFGNISALINFNCILRTLELKDKNQTDAYGQLFKDIPTVGFSSYGESYIGHINQTATMLLFK